jgi:hypothetical protein
MTSSGLELATLRLVAWRLAKEREWNKMFMFVPLSVRDEIAEKEVSEWILDSRLLSFYTTFWLLSYISAFLLICSYDTHTHTYICMQIYIDSCVACITTRIRIYKEDKVTKTDEQASFQNCPSYPYSIFRQFSNVCSETLLLISFCAD